MKSLAKISRLDRWRKSAEFREIARQAARRANAARQHAPKCGARRKSDGGSCQLPALANGRCYIHGGRTPKGKGWHKPQLPARDGPEAIKKLDTKLRDLERRRKAREARIAAMTPEQRARYDAWQRSHQPGPSERERGRRDRDARRLLSELMQDDETGRRVATTGSVFD